MKLIIEHTDQCSRSDLGVGRVWVGTTDQGTPVKVLVSGLKSGSDDPAVVERFDEEHAALPEAPTHCPDCGEPLSEHELVEQRQVSIDLYEVVARWVAAYGGTSGLRPPPEGWTPSAMADQMRARLEQADKTYHDALVAAAEAVTTYIIAEVMEGQGIEQLYNIGKVAGHA